MKKPVPITDAEAFDSSRWTHKHDDLVKHIIDQIGHPDQHLDAIAHELAVQIGSDAQLCASLLERYSQQYLDDCTKHRTETARQMVQSFIRRAKITPGGQSMPKIRSSSELPDDEGRVFVTYMPDAPFHVMGRRADSGELFVTGIVPKEKITTEHLEHVFRIEVVTGREAEDLIAALVSEGKACGVMPAFVFERRRDIELETGLILAGDLLVYILDGAESAEDCQQISKHIIQRLIKKAKSTQMADNGLVGGWREGERPQNAREILNNDKLMSVWAQRSLRMKLRVDSRKDGFMRIDSDIARGIGAYPRSLNQTKQRGE